MGGKEIGVRSDVFFTFYSLLSTLYFLFSGETDMSQGSQRAMKMGEGQPPNPLY
ncbi:MAG: hypothetical protein AB1422_18380 [bacterium]